MRPANAARAAGRDPAHNPGVRRLAANPLLLTILALMKRQGVTLPERRVELYDQYVTTLPLYLEPRARPGGTAGGPGPRFGGDAQILAPLALWMHEVNPGVGLVPREDLRRRIEALYAERGDPDAELSARQFLRDLGADAGLLLERGPGNTVFIHLTFEEYLAAVAIARRGQQGVQAVVDYLAARVGNAHWHEVGCLAVGYLGIIQQRDEAAGAVAEGLAACTPRTAGGSGRVGGRGGGRRIARWRAAGEPEVGRGQFGGDDAERGRGRPIATPGGAPAGRPLRLAAGRSGRVCRDSGGGIPVRRSS